MINTLLDLELVKSVGIAIMLISVLVGVFGCLILTISLIVSNDRRDDLTKLGSYLLVGSIVMAFLAFCLAIMAAFL